VTGPPPRVEAFGDAAVLITVGEAIDPAVSRLARAVAASIHERRGHDPRFGRPVTAYASVLVPFDATQLGSDEAVAIVADIAINTDPQRTAAPGRLVEIPVRYGRDDGLDLAAIAAERGLTVDEVIDAHSGTEYEAYFLGFAPGFAYLGRVPAEIAVPRLATPRRHVPAGSVGIAGEQTGVYPADLPGGWRIVGRTDVLMWDLTRESPALVEPGDRVRFVPVGR
jgi:KipI family sensor histidine kinase inhibitor